MPVRQLMVVVLPAPLGPSRQNTRLGSMANQLPLTAQNSPPLRFLRGRPALEQQHLREGGRGARGGGEAGQGGEGA